MAVVLVSGMATLDFIFQLPELPTAAIKYRADDVDIVGGGNAANAAVAIARLGGRPVFVGRLGDDEIGGRIRDGLEEEGVDCTHIRIAHGGRSSYSSISIDAAGERQIVNFRGSGLPTQPGPMAAAAAGAGAVLADTRWPEAAGAALEFARANTIPGIVDAEALMPEGLAELASHVAFSRQGLAEFTGIDDVDAALRNAARRVPGQVLVTDGAAGTSFVDAGRLITIPGFEVKAVDTLGAGDVWHGAFALGLAEGMDHTAAIRFANAVAALKCTAFGGRRATPDRAHADAYLMENT